MEFNRSEKGMLGFLAVGAAMVFGVLFWPFVPETWKSSTGAAWVQAIMTGGAVIAGALGIAWQVRRQHEEQDRQRVADEIRRLQVLWTLVYHSRAEMEYVCTLPKKIEAFLMIPNGLAHKINALRGVPPLEIPDGRSAIALLTMVEAYDAFFDNSKEFVAHVFDGSRRTAWKNFVYSERSLRRALILRGADYPTDTELAIERVEYPPLEAY